LVRPVTVADVAEEVASAKVAHVAPEFDEYSMT
jgi:hypothetical protein